MAYIDIDIEDYLDEVDTRFLVRELNDRKKTGKLKKELDEIIDELDIDPPGWPKIKTLMDKEKQEYILNNWDKITIHTLEYNRI